MTMGSESRCETMVYSICETKEKSSFSCLAPLRSRRTTVPEVAGSHKVSLWFAAFCCLQSTPLFSLLLIALYTIDVGGRIYSAGGRHLLIA